MFATMFAGVVLNFLMPERVFEVFASVTVFGLVCAWSSILVSHLNFRKRRIQEGREADIKYKMPFYPYANYIALAFVAIVLVCIGFLPDMRISLVVSGAWVAVVYVAYLVYTGRVARQPVPAAAEA